MHPAPSIIVFTTVSGAGYGLLFLLGLGVLAGLLHADAVVVAGTVLALILVTVGLASSTFHLKHPERAWRAISQWRSSWLSREGLAALLTYLPAAALMLLAGIGPADHTVWRSTAGGLTALGAALTVWCTGMIYGSLKPVHAWHQRLTPWLYVAHALMAGALLLYLLLLFSAADAAPGGWLALLMLAVAPVIEFLWRRQGATGERPTIGSATGLGTFGTVRMVEPPHTQTNYLLTEMGFRVGRKHALKLRAASWACLALAGLMTIIALATGGLAAVVLALVAAAAGLLATALGRWLFFAEATHTVTLYYGNPAA